MNLMPPDAQCDLDNTGLSCNMCMWQVLNVIAGTDNLSATCMLQPQTLQFIELY